MENLLLEVDFNQIEGSWVCSGKGNQGRIHGNISVVRGHDGKKALYFNNQAGVPAAQYVDFGRVVPGKENFSVSLWIKTHRDGCNGWPYYTEIISGEEFSQSGSRKEQQKRYGGTLLANTGYGDDREGRGKGGFSIANLQQNVYFNTCFWGADSQAGIRLWGMKEPDDDRWHQITITFDRRASEKIYLDGVLLKKTDISSMLGQDIDGGNLILGSDGQYCNGLGEVAVSSLRISHGVMCEDQIVALFALEDIGRIEDELKQRPLPSEIYSPGTVKELMLAAGKISEKTGELRDAWEEETADSCKVREMLWRVRREEACRLRESLLDRYETFLQNMKKPEAAFVLMSDAHVEGYDSPRALAYGNALAWAGELHMDAFADCGDYSNYGKAQELDGYWDAVAKNRGDMAALVVLGNHETLEKSCSELVAYHTGKLAENKTLPPDYGELYYEYSIGDYHFLVLSQYSDTYTVTGYNRMWAHAADLKEKQIKWLEEKLNVYCGQGRPVMLFIHNAIRQLLGRQTDGNYRETAVILSNWAERFYLLLEQHPDVVICTGHVHHGFGANCGASSTRDGYHIIDVPSFCQNKKGYGMSSELGPVSAHTGYFVFLFGNKLLLRAVEFESRKWLTAYDQLIEIGE